MERPGPSTSPESTPRVYYTKAQPKPRLGRLIHLSRLSTLIHLRAYVDTCIEVAVNLDGIGDYGDIVCKHGGNTYFIRVVETGTDVKECIKQFPDEFQKFNYTKEHEDVFGNFEFILLMTDDVPQEYKKFKYTEKRSGIKEQKGYFAMKKTNIPSCCEDHNDFHKLICTGRNVDHIFTLPDDLLKLQVSGGMQTKLHIFDNQVPVEEIYDLLEGQVKATFFYIKNINRKAPILSPILIQKVQQWQAQEDNYFMTLSTFKEIIGTSLADLYDLISDFVTRRTISAMEKQTIKRQEIDVKYLSICFSTDFERIHMKETRFACVEVETHAFSAKENTPAVVHEIDETGQIEVVKFIHTTNPQIVLGEYKKYRHTAILTDLKTLENNFYDILESWKWRKYNVLGVVIIDSWFMSRVFEMQLIEAIAHIHKTKKFIMFVSSNAESPQFIDSFISKLFEVLQEEIRKAAHKEAENPISSSELSKLVRMYPTPESDSEGGGTPTKKKRSSVKKEN